MAIAGVARSVQAIRSAGLKTRGPFLRCTSLGRMAGGGPFTSAAEIASTLLVEALYELFNEHSEIFWNGFATVRTSALQVR